MTRLKDLSVLSQSRNAMSRETLCFLLDLQTRVPYFTNSPALTPLIVRQKKNMAPD